MASGFRTFVNLRRVSASLVSVVFAALVLVPGRTFATIIDFETGFVDQQPLLFPMVASDGNEVTFTVGPGPGRQEPAYIAGIGAPRSAFDPGDLPAGPSVGSYFLTDENLTGQVSRWLDYFVTFRDPVRNLSLDLIDFRGDGGGRIGGVATLTVYSDLFFTAVGSDSFTATPGLPEGNIVTLSVLFPSANIRSAALRYGRDVGTAIDNVAFDLDPQPVTSAPEPASLALLGTGLLGAALRRRRRRS